MTLSDLAAQRRSSAAAHEEHDVNYEALCARDVEFVEAPEKQPWGGSLAHFRDPDGNVLTLLEA